MMTAVEPSVSNLLQRFGIVRAATMKLIEPLTSEDLMVQSSPDASPVKWHLAHTSWFFETFVLREFLSAYQAFHPDFYWLFNSYYNALGEMPEKKLRSSFSRPPVDAILAYRVHVDAAIAGLLESGSVPDEAQRRIVLGLEHEQQHQELIATDIKHALFTNPLHPAYIESKAGEAGEAIAPPIEWVSFEGGLTQIGLDLDPAEVEAFAFDNETPRHSVFLVPYSLSNRLVTCAEYLAFIEQDGYARPELWLSEGWSKMREEGWEAPLYWTRDKATKSGWSIYTLHGMMPLEELSETAVCHLSFFEADAYARWAGCRLPTEFEWEHAASTLKSTAGNFIESHLLHTSTAPSGAGLKQVFGDTWEWTSSGYTGYPGYKPLPGALGEYNGKFMSSQVILRGGSCVTPASHIRPTYRNFFPPATRWQFSGLRLAR
ncbi:ergothioneine biosynthesis protein EgtB [Granulicella aggregans]|uniref:ergothioneine biosynthesis protein EgtB n=1 Tax=Granulicella aggregans TaxID=474949 RepID=UPI0021DF43F2|nr:ergothioneine biosynthesis protein EgtB [Granulicella aggregans]